MLHQEEPGAMAPMEFRFNSAERPIRVELINQEPWFVAKDVCDALGLSNPTEALKALDDDEKLTSEILRSGQRRKANFINESGIYSLIFRSNKPEAKLFRKWVTNEVLPQIRRNGHYSPGGAPGFRLEDAGDHLTELGKLIVQASRIAGTQRQVAQYLDVSESVLTDIRNRPYKISAGLKRRVETGCRDIIRLGDLPQFDKQNLNTRDLTRMWFDIALIESYDVRKRISQRMRRILAREEGESRIPILREKGGAHA